MSKFKLRLNMNGEIRLCELDRKNPDFSVIQPTIKKKFNVTSNTNLSFVLPSGTRIAINSIEDLQRAQAETLKIKGKFIELEVAGGYRAGGASAAASKPAPVAAAPPKAAAAPKATPPPAAAAPAGSGEGVLSFVVPASGGADKVKIGAQQEADCYKFVPTPAKNPTTIDVELPNNRALVFKITSATAKLTQTFNMPFDVSPKDLSMEGSTVVLKFPW
eukprot:TRINITY_DN9186_c0_g1_i1.p1 TRINITY_DN9186_c0_g1~~TRINITY_DN9186_c0_g1_i1.p1  ORF type:complete len:229 (-),score=73.24 TRINITY_DN9186_c0_g1_i1:59-712(-)